MYIYIYVCVCVFFGLYAHIHLELQTTNQFEVWIFGDFQPFLMMWSHPTETNYKEMDVTASRYILLYISICVTIFTKCLTTTNRETQGARSVPCLSFQKSPKNNNDLLGRSTFKAIPNKISLHFIWPNHNMSPT